MIVDDLIYGKYEINEEVLVELIKSKPVQRLKNISQLGPAVFVFPGKKISRYDHSVGVMILLKKLNASIEEQIAGLLHDVPHTAFSHVADSVFSTKEKSYHELFHEKIIMDSEIPIILKKFNIAPEIILKTDNFSLLESEIPNLCADRIDYALRDSTSRFGFDKNTNNYINSFVVVNKEILMNNIEYATSFSDYYLNAAYKIWYSPLHATTYYLLGNAMKIALKESIITEEDMFKDDDFIIKKLESSNNQEIKRNLSLLNKNMNVEKNNKDYDFVAKHKLRYIDPKVIDSKGNIRRASELSNEFKNHLEEYKKWIEEKDYIKILNK